MVVPRRSKRFSGHGARREYHPPKVWSVCNRFYHFALVSAWEVPMRRRIFGFAICFALAGAVHAQLTKNVLVQAGTPEDKATREISAATDPAQKLALIDKFQADLGKG